MATLSIPIGVTAASLLGDDGIRAVPAASRAAGFGGLLFDSASGIDLTGLSESGRRELRHTLSTQGQSFIGLSIDLGGKGLAKDADRSLWRLERVIDAVAGMSVGGRRFASAAVRRPRPAPRAAPPPSARGRRSRPSKPVAFSFPRSRVVASPRRPSRRAAAARAGRSGRR